MNGAKFFPFFRFYPRWQAAAYLPMRIAPACLGGSIGSLARLRLEDDQFAEIPPLRYRNSDVPMATLA
jgi:hypothetical protein